MPLQWSSYSPVDISFPWKGWRTSACYPTRNPLFFFVICYLFFSKLSIFYFFIFCFLFSSEKKRKAKGETCQVDEPLTPQLREKLLHSHQQRQGMGMIFLIIVTFSWLCFFLISHSCHTCMDGFSLLASHHRELSGIRGGTSARSRRYRITSSDQQMHKQVKPEQRCFSGVTKKQPDREFNQ